MLITKRHDEDWLEELQRSSDFEDEKVRWRKLWKVEVPANLHMIFWRLSRVSVPSEDVLHNRKMCSSSAALCVVPKTHGGTLSLSVPWHVVSRLLWMRTWWSPWWWQQKQILLQCALPHDQLITRLVVTMWAIWTAPRKAILEGNFQIPIDTHEFDSWYISELEGLKDLQTTRPTVDT